MACLVFSRLQAVPNGQVVRYEGDEQEESQGSPIGEALLERAEDLILGG